MAKTRRPIEPLLWLLFSAGGMASAMLMPALVFLLGLAFPLGWLGAPDYDHLRTLMLHPVTRLVLFGVCMLSLFHWAHRFKYTLYDGLQVKHLNELLNTVCYGGAIVGSIVAAYLLWR
ncbi:MAG: fumarate reductase subunit FrdD [Gemmatimonadaceae bacterium]